MDVVTPCFKVHAGLMPSLRPLSAALVSHSGSNSITIYNVISKFLIIIYSRALEYHKYFKGGISLSE